MGRLNFLEDDTLSIWPKQTRRSRQFKWSQAIQDQEANKVVEVLTGKGENEQEGTTKKERWWKDL